MAEMMNTPEFKACTAVENAIMYGNDEGYGQWYAEQLAGALETVTLQTLYIVPAPMRKNMNRVKLVIRYAHTEHTLYFPNQTMLDQKVAWFTKALADLGIALV